MNYFACSQTNRQTDQRQQKNITSVGEAILWMIRVDDYWIRVFKCVWAQWWGGETSAMTSGYFYTTYICSALTSKSHLTISNGRLVSLLKYFLNYSPVMTPSIFFAAKYSIKKEKPKRSFIQAVCLVLGWSTFGTNYSHKLCTPGIEDNLPFFFTDPVQVLSVGSGPFGISRSGHLTTFTELSLSLSWTAVFRVIVS